MIYENYDSFIFDLDGTIYRGSNLISGADKTVNHLKSIGKKVLFVSNKTTGTNADYHKFLSEFGLNINKDEIITATEVLSKYLNQEFCEKKFFAIGEQVFVNAIKKSGLNFTNDPEEVDILLVTLDRTFNYEKLEIAARSLEKGAKFFAANIDDTCPVDEGEVLDAGSVISALEKRTHRKLEKHFGKPSEFMMNEILCRLDSSKEKTLLIGDRIETDIAMGNKFGIDTALVATGVKYFPNGNGNIKPVYQLNSVNDLINFDV